jgi:tetratricopeptide (TPR) repeat protein
MSPEQLSEFLPFLLHGAIIIVIGALILGKIIVNFPLAFLKFMLYIPELIINPASFLIKMLRLISLLQLLKWLNTKVEERCFDEVLPLTLPEIFIILFSSTFLLISSPSEIILEELAIIGFFSAWMIYKVLSIKYIQSVARRAKLFERGAQNASKRGLIKLALSLLHKALALREKPLLLDHPRLNPDRAKCFEQMGIVLYEDYQTKKALNYFSKAFDIYKEPLYLDESKPIKSHAKALKESMKIFAQRRAT